MHDIGELTLDPSDGTWLDAPEYRADFKSRRSQVRNAHSWKFERRQYFEEDPSDQIAIRQGNWDEATRDAEGRREEFTRSVNEDRSKGTLFHRVRIVEEPLSPYLQWELRSLRVQAECGKPIRVVNAVALREFEPRVPLPEVVVLGDQTLYEVIYTDDGAPKGAIRFTDGKIINTWVEFIKNLYDTGESVIDYVSRFPSP